MNIVSGNDFLQVKVASLIADYDSGTLANLYQPIIGYQASSLYLTLKAEADNQKVTSLITHGQLFLRMHIQPGDFVDARQALEAIGLLKTYLSSTPGTNIYYYELYAPKTPKSFFDNALLYGLLIKNVGEADANRLKAVYSLENHTSDNGTDISASFTEVFHPDFDNPIFAKVLANKGVSIGRESAKIQCGFSYEKFFLSLSQISQIKADAFNKKDMKEIERLATLYGVNEEVAANDVANLYDVHASKGKRVDFEALAKLFQDETNYNYLAIKRNKRTPGYVSGSTDLAQKINLMESTSPKDYLVLLQNGSKPAGSDLKLLNDLSSNFHLPNSVINAMVDFVLTTNNNVLSRAYCEKIAASLAREGVQTTVDAMDYLIKVSHPKGQKSSSRPTGPSGQTEKEEKPDKTKKGDVDVDSLDWEQMIDDLDTSGGSDGKA